METKAISKLHGIYSPTVWRSAGENAIDRRAFADVSGAMPDVGRNGRGVALSDFEFFSVRPGVLYSSLDNHQDFRAIGMIVARITLAGI